MSEKIGKRIARLRLERGLTQQDLANRLAISRVAVSHIEMDLSVPGERTITLLAGVFKISPQSLVEGTTYPRAKAERLPASACAYTQLELDLALMYNDLAWLERIRKEDIALNGDKLRSELVARWQPRLDQWAGEYLEPREQESLAKANQALRLAGKNG